ncbi:MAG: carbamoyltransferase HypF [Desulfobacteraceae bacterium]|nr:carbamoyltransferase HypF [Desulfobacteraceae bacterium]
MAESKTKITARKIDVNGIVQGVGFRPFIYQLARHHHLAGKVANTAEGVSIHLEGPDERIEAFLSDLPKKKPPLAYIDSVHLMQEAVEGRRDFEITLSRSFGSRNTLISPDVSICEDCRREMFDFNDRRYGYPFINCTNCGPRYTIIEDIPYDRPKTSMHPFKMCARCLAEYNCPEDRRFHAQPNACQDCGPHVSLLDNKGRAVSADDPIAKTAQLIQQGKIVAIKGLGGFHLAVDALNDSAVQRLRQRKHREEKPLAVMSPDLDTIATYAHLAEAEKALLTSIQRPIVLLPKRLPEKLAFAVAPRNHYYGVMLAYTPLHYLLMNHGFTAVVMTSGNLSQEPIAIDNQEACDRLKKIADYFLVHNRGIYLRSDDSIVRHAAGETRLIRRSRGYVPVPVFLRQDVPCILACGAELKNTICLTRGKQAFVSQHIGDLENLAAEDFFKLTIRHLERILDIAPEAIACDMHPDYLSTQWAVSQNKLPVIHVQHHHAHVVSCMAEHKLQGPVIGLSFDGTGFGPDHSIWGGEVLLADEAGYQRVACLEPCAMPGGAAAIKEPWRMGLAFLHMAFGRDIWNLELPILKLTDRAKAEIILDMIAKGINSPLTSSLGRLFDGVAAIIGLRRTVSYEGQAAMELEMISDGQAHGTYPVIWHEKTCTQLDTGAFVKSLVEDIQNGLPGFITSRKFHDTVIEAFAGLCTKIRKKTQLNRVVLSGGCFQNALLLEGLINVLKTKCFEVYSHHQIPANDGGLSLGQAIVAASAVSGKTSEVN